MTFTQYQEVQLKREIKDLFFGEHVTVKPGIRGVVMEIYPRTEIETGYDVEFFDKTGNTIAVTTVQESDLEPWVERTA
jgi:hypothetical protein